MTEPNTARVECYSGHTYAQEPRVVVWQGTRYAVTEVESRWRTPTGPAFRVRTEPERAFDLYYDESQDRWTTTNVPITNIPKGQAGSPTDKEVQT